MPSTDQRLTALDIVNRVRLKSKIGPVSTFSQDSDALTKLQYLNDVIAEVSDYGNWQETLKEITVTVQSSVSDYSIPVSAVAVVQNIHEVVYNNEPGEMRKVDLDTIRRLNRTRSFGQPRQWGVVGTDDNANPIFRVSPIPTSVQAGNLFNLLVYQKPAFLVTADISVIPPFPGLLLTQGLLAKTVLDESDGEPTSRYLQVKKVYDDMLYEAFNRYNGDTGSTVFFRPGRGRR